MELNAKTILTVVFGLLGVVYIILPHSLHVSLGIDFGLSHMIHIVLGVVFLVIAGLVYWKME